MEILKNSKTPICTKSLPLKEALQRVIQYFGYFTMIAITGLFYLWPFGLAYALYGTNTEGASSTHSASHFCPRDQFRPRLSYSQYWLLGVYFYLPLRGIRLPCLAACIKRPRRHSPLVSMIYITLYCFHPKKGNSQKKKRLPLRYAIYLYSLAIINYYSLTINTFLLIWRMLELSSLATIIVSSLLRKPH